MPSRTSCARRTGTGSSPTTRSSTDLNGLPEAASAWSINPFKAPDAIFLFQQKCDFHATHGAPQVPAADRLDGRRARRRDGDRRGGRRLRAAPARLALARTVVHHLRASARRLVLRHKMHSHHSWVRCRLAAEFCRSALATWGLPRAAPLLQNLDLAGARGLTRALYILHTRSSAARPVPIEEFKRIYLEKRIDDQLAYYDRQVNRAHAALQAAGGGVLDRHGLRRSSCTASTRSPERCIPRLPAWLAGTTFVFLPIALPVVAAAGISIISINDLQRRVARYREMRTLLEASRAQISSCRTWNSLEHVVLKTERALLQEVIEWHSIRSFSESH